MFKWRVKMNVTGGEQVCASSSLTRKELSEEKRTTQKKFKKEKEIAKKLQQNVRVANMMTIALLHSAPLVPEVFEGATAAGPFPAHRMHVLNHQCGFPPFSTLRPPNCAQRHTHFL